MASKVLTLHDFFLCLQPLLFCRHKAIQDFDSSIRFTSRNLVPEEMFFLLLHQYCNRRMVVKSTEYGILACVIATFNYKNIYCGVTLIFSGGKNIL